MTKKKLFSRLEEGDKRIWELAYVTARARLKDDGEYKQLTKEIKEQLAAGKRKHLKKSYGVLALLSIASILNLTGISLPMWAAWMFYGFAGLQAVVWAMVVFAADDMLETMEVFEKNLDENYHNESTLKQLVDSMKQFEPSVKERFSWFTFSDTPN